MSTALTDDSKLNLSFKKVLGKAQTSNTKEISNEAIGSNISIGASTIFGYTPPTPVSSAYYAIIGGIAEKVPLKAEPMAGTKDSNGRYQAFALSLPADYQTKSSNPNKGSGFYVNGQVLNQTTGTLQIIPPSFGANYTALTYHTSSGTGTQVPALDARDWVLDYFNGIFFQQDPPSDTDENPAYIDAFIYIGDYALTRLTGSGGAPGGATTQIQFNNASSFGGSANLTFNGTTLTGSYTGSVGELTTLSASFATVSEQMGIGTVTPQAQFHVSSSNAENLLRVDGALPQENPILYVTSSGFVGIGTSTPIAPLHITGALDPALLIEDGNIHLSGTNSSHHPEIQFIDNSGIGVAGLKIRYNNGTGNSHFENMFNNASRGIIFTTRAADAGGDDVLALVGDKAGIGTTTPTHTLTTIGSSYLSGGVVHKRRAVATSHTASVTDYILGVTGVPTSILFDATAFTEGQVLVIKDESGNASSTSGITLVPSGSQKIDGATSQLIESAHGSVLLYSNGANWFIY
jgi:hypothetical protein